MARFLKCCTPAFIALVVKHKPPTVDDFGQQRRMRFGASGLGGMVI